MLMSSGGDLSSLSRLVVGGAAAKSVARPFTSPLRRPFAG
jgi:hypothetical protein